MQEHVFEKIKVWQQTVILTAMLLPLLFAVPASAMEAYWTEPGFPDIAIQGPQQTTGIIFYSHGVKGDAPQFQFPSPPILRKFAETGWDVVRINRNNLYEGRGWLVGGLRHVSDLEVKIKIAQGQGYKRVIAAGQSYGGAISLEVGKRVDLFGVIALAPGPGSDAANITTSVSGWQNHGRFTVKQIEEQKAERVLIVAPGGDIYYPAPRGPEFRAAFLHHGTPFILLAEDNMSITGHGAGTSNSFVKLYGNCVLKFFNPKLSPANGETICTK